MPRFVVTGAPGTGKTTVISLLSQRYVTVREPARELIAQHAAATGETTLDGRPELFLSRLLESSIDDFTSVADDVVAFFGRGLPDCVAYAAVLDLDARGPLEQATRFATIRGSSSPLPGRRSTREMPFDGRRSNKSRRSTPISSRRTSALAIGSSNCPWPPPWNASR
jgi:hypothetical protein